MVVKVYVSGISGNKEVKKRQQRVLMIMDSRNIKYDLIDITEPGNEGDKDFMQANSTSLGATIGDTSPRHPLPPQIFNDASYCGDYDQFDLSNENDELEKFLKLSTVDDSNVTVTSSSADDVILTNSNNGDQHNDVREEDTNEAQALEVSNEAEAAPSQSNGAIQNGENAHVEQNEADEGADV